MGSKQRHRSSVLLAVLLALAAAACSPGSATEAIETGDLQQLDGVGDLRTRFNGDAGVPRLILLVSPT